MYNQRTYPVSVLDFRPVLTDHSGSSTEKDFLAEPSLRELVYKYYGDHFVGDLAIDHAAAYLDQIIKKINGLAR